MIKDGIIDPVKVIQTALQGAARTSTLMMARSIMLQTRMSLVYTIKVALGLHR